MKPDRTTDTLHLTRALDHLRAAIRYAERGKAAFFDDEVPDTYLLVEGELRKAFESLNRLGRSFFDANPRFDPVRIGEIRQLLTHDYADVDREAVWSIVREDAPKMVRWTLRAKRPVESE